jgi:hypothetical protein
MSPKKKIADLVSLVHSQQTPQDILKVWFLTFLNQFEDITDVSCELIGTVHHPQGYSFRYKFLGIENSSFSPFISPHNTIQCHHPLTSLPISLVMGADEFFNVFKFAQSLKTPHGWGKEPT